MVAAAVVFRETASRPLFIAPSNSWSTTWTKYVGWPLTAVHVYDIENYPDGLAGTGKIIRELQYKVVAAGAIADLFVVIWLLGGMYLSMVHWARRCGTVQFRLGDLFSTIAVIAIFLQLKRLDPLLQDVFSRVEANVRYDFFSRLLGVEPIRCFDVPIWFAECCAIYATWRVLLLGARWAITRV